MPLLKKPPNFDFMGRRKAAVAISATMIIIAAISLSIQQLSFGIDFTGGILIEVDYDSQPDLGGIRSALAEIGYPDAVVQTFGSAQSVSIRLPPAADDTDRDKMASDIEARLKQDDPSAHLAAPPDFIGAQVGQDLANQGGLALLFALILIFGYVMLRFRWKFAAGAIIALIHDVIVTIGFFSVTRLTFDLPALAAVLAVIGYSLNDTIVVYDRIRENFRFIRRGTPEQIVNTSINQTLSRTLITAWTTLLVLFALYFLGGDALESFSLALIVGIVVGTYSSVYVASAAALMLKVTPKDLMPVKVEEIDDMP